MSTLAESRGDEGVGGLGRSATRRVSDLFTSTDGGSTFALNTAFKVNRQRILALSAGTQEFWVVDAGKHTVQVTDLEAPYRGGPSVRRLSWIVITNINLSIQLLLVDRPPTVERS